MLGRERERVAIDGLLADPGGDGRRGLLFVGDPGIGKTTLLGYARRAARAEGWLVLSARGDAAAAEQAFDALTGLLRSLEPEIGSLPEPLARALRSALSLAPGVADADTVNAAALRLIAGRAETQPVLLALDDVHWFDRSSAATLAFVHRHLDTERVASIATAAAGDRHGAPEWDRALAVRPLAGLAEHDLAALVGDVALAPSVARRCRQLTLGNPLGFLELVNRLSPGQRDGTEALPDLQDPGPVITHAFAQRLAGLPTRVRRSLSVAAADGTGRVSVVRAALALLGTRIDLVAAEAAGVVVLAGDEVAFAHPLLRAAAYHSVAPASRRKAHQALAAVLHEPQDAEHRAWQLAAAAAGPDEIVADGLALVAERARARGAVASAAQVLEQAAALSPEPDGARDRLAVAGELWLTAGEVVRAKGVLERARALAQADRSGLSAHLWGAIVDRWVAGPRAAAAGLRAVLAEAIDQVVIEELSAAIADEDQISGSSIAPGARVERAAPGHPAGEARARLREASARLQGDADAIASVGALLAPVATSPLALDAAARSARARLLEGDLLGACHELTAALMAGTSMIPGARAEAELELARVEALLGRASAAEARLEHIGEIAASLGASSLDDLDRRVRGLLALGGGRFGAAIGLLAPLDRPGVADGHALAADHAEALVGDGRVIDRPAWRGRLDALAPAPGTLAAGLVQRAAGLVDDDRERLVAAARALEPFPLEHARTLLVIAERDGAPSEPAAAARSLFERLGAVPWADRAQAVLDRASAPAPNEAAVALAALSAAERRVAMAVGAGRSNREAAAELFLSVKTVDHHLQQIYRKLALRGRSELAVLVTRGTA